jgi:lipid II:glycine glycyltransferase (peptidoglycan interpeptide bridge formation enzyme)
MIYNYTVKARDSMNEEDLDNFVYNHPHGNIFQTPEMAEVYKRTKNYEPLTLAAINTKNGEMLAILQTAVIKEMSGILGSFSARSIIQGGLLFIEDENGVKALKVLMEHYDKIAQKKALYTQIRTMWDTSNISSFLNRMGYEYEERLNFLIDLTIPTDLLWRQLFKSRRNGINRAKRRGVTIEEVTDKCLIPIVYNHLQETYKNAKLPLADISLFQNVFNILVQKNMAKFFLARHEDKYIGAIVVLIYNGVVYDWYAGASLGYLQLCPNDILPWHVMEWGSNNGYHTFDFGGAGNPNEEYGVREFKRQFGGEMVNFGRYMKIHSHIKMRIAEKGFDVYRRFL